MAEKSDLHISVRAVKYSEALNFFRETRRKPACPTCDFVGPWNLIIDDTGGHETGQSKDPDLLLFLLPTSGKFGLGSVPYISIVCPQCSHSEFIQANDIANLADKIVKGNAR